MIKAPIKKEFQENVIVVKHVLDLFVDELQRTDNFVIDKKVMRATRKAKLNAYRQMINTELREIEKNYEGGTYDREEVEIDKCYMRI